MSVIPRAILVSPASIPITNDNKNNVAITRNPVCAEIDLTTKRNDIGRRRNSAPVPMSVQPNIFFKLESRFSLRATNGAITSREKIKIKYGKICNEEFEDKDVVIRTKIIVSPHASTMPLPIERADFCVKFISLCPYVPLFY